MKLFVAKSLLSIVVVTGSLSEINLASTHSNFATTLLTQFPPRLDKKPGFRKKRDNDLEERRERWENICDRRLGEDELDECREEVRENRHDDQDNYRRPLRRNVNR